MSKVWIWILSLLLAGALGLSAYLYFYTDVEPSEECEESTTEECVEELSTFTGTDVKISFDYPASWGTATEEVTDAADSTEDIVAEGKIFNINFADNPFLTISGASPDFESGGIGGVCPIRQFYNGDTENLACSSIEDTSGEIVNCQQVSVDDENGTDYYYLPETECATIGINRVIYLPTKDDAFPGLVMEMRIVWDEDLQLANMGARVSAGDDTNDYLANTYTEIMQDIEDAATSSVEDYLPKLQIDQLDALLESMEYIT
ncbi:hypothetical protein ACFL14_01550 [Patescibacteria group bacterium]